MIDNAEHPGLTDDEILLTTKEFKRAVGCGNTRMYQIINSGAVDARKLGRETKITLASTKRLINGLPKYQPRAA